MCEYYDCVKGLVAYNDAKKACLKECGDPADPRTDIFDYLKCLAKYTPPGSGIIHVVQSTATSLDVLSAGY